jgi:tyrosinase
MDESDMLSYFQVAGIHGLPFIPWDNGSAVADWQWGGYCTHGNYYHD